MLQRGSGISLLDVAARSRATLFCAGFAFIFAMASPAEAQEKATAAPDAFELQLFAAPGFSGEMRSLSLAPGKPYAYVERLEDAEATAVRSLQAGASLGVVLFRRAFFAAQDGRCTPTLGSDEQPGLIWTGPTADFLPVRSGKAGVAALPDAGEEGYGSAILYRRDLGPPPGALLMKRRRSYSRGCGNILRSFNFDRRFIPLEFQTEASAAGAPPGCVNLKGTSAGKAVPTDMLRSDRIALLQPSDLDRRYGDKERQFQAILFAGENCSGESVSLTAPYRAAGKGTTAADQDGRRDVLLSSLLFRDRAQSLRLVALDKAGRLIASPNGAAPMAAKPQPVPTASPSKVASTAAKELSAPKAETAPAQVENPPTGKADTASAVAVPQAPAPKTAAPRTVAQATPEPKVVPQTTAAKTAAPGVALPTAKLEPMTESPPALRARAANTPQAKISGAPTPQAASSGIRSTGLVQTPAQPSPTESVPTDARSQTPTQVSQAPISEAQVSHAQVSQVQAAPQPAAPNAASDGSSSGGEESASQVFTFPVYDVYRLNYCLRRDGQCGEPAAQKWCQMKGFERAVAWQKDDNIGGLFPTFLIGDEEICAQYKCDGFAEITCGR